MRLVILIENTQEKPLIKWAIAKLEAIMDEISFEQCLIDIENQKVTITPALKPKKDNKKSAQKRVA